MIWQQDSKITEIMLSGGHISRSGPAPGKDGASHGSMPSMEMYFNVTSSIVQG
jgi:hypothetical protein